MCIFGAYDHLDSCRLLEGITEWTRNWKIHFFHSHALPSDVWNMEKLNRQRVGTATKRSENVQE